MPLPPSDQQSLAAPPDRTLPQSHSESMSPRGQSPPEYSQSAAHLSSHQALHSETQHQQSVLLSQVGRPLTAEEASPYFTTTEELQSKHLPEHTNGHHALEGGEDTEPEEEGEEEEEEDIDVESSSDDESQGQRFNSNSSTAQATTAGSEQGSEFSGGSSSSSDGSESTTDGNSVQLEEGGGGSQDTELLLHEELYTQASDTEEGAEEDRTAQKLHLNHYRKSLKLPGPPSLIKISESNVHSQQNGFSASLSSKQAIAAVCNPRPSKLTNGTASHFDCVPLPQPPALRRYQESSNGEADMISKVIEQVRPHRELTARMASNIVLEKMNAFGFKKNGFKVYSGGQQVWGSEGGSCELTVGKQSSHRGRREQHRKQHSVTSMKRRFSKRGVTTQFHAVA